MPINILVFDHFYNIETISALSSTDSRLKIFGYNSIYSFNDNYDIVKPQLTLVNKNYYSDSIEISNINIQYYESPNFIVNSLIIPKHIKNPEPVLIYDGTEISDKDILFKKKYVKIFGIDKNHQLKHHQYMGYIDSSKTLHSIINTYNFILSNNTLVYGICAFVKSNAGIYKTNNMNIPNINYITNNNIYEQYISNLF